ncbi:hypothetical protein GH714_022625 [Hevea brasiliensis]|uniref:Uncharacterized protein n=1 Tax=Hevea brasiliensis TaxID=3981 RepID=A0A6A6NJR0_HEVBR|nr:hypothetical protein GH714_022625 [Hevea brasiliensis]
MEGKEVVKIENFVGSTTFPDHIESSYPLQGLFDFCEGDRSSLGFMELLASKPVVTKMESPEALNQPATPNSSSISSASSEALNDEPVMAADNEEEEQQKTKKE